LFDFSKAIIRFGPKGCELQVMLDPRYPTNWFLHWTLQIKSIWQAGFWWYVEMKRNGWRIKVESKEIVATDLLSMWFKKETLFHFKKLI
jgi:hypothetical protein